MKNFKEGMKASYYQQDIVVMDACMKRVMKDTRGGGQMSSNYTFFYEIRIRGVKIVQEEKSEGIYCCGPVKISH